MKKIKVGIIGAAGYTGGELFRLLLKHPNVKINFALSRSNSGKKVFTIHKDLFGETNLIFTNKINDNVDLLFLCLNHGESKKFLDENNISAKIKIIDLSQDFRLNENSNYKKRNFIYGLPEKNKKIIRTAKNIANPGCFATALQLSLLPLANKNLLNEVYSTGITGSTGAGQKQSETSHFSWRENNIQAYKSLSHQHIFEVTETLQKIQKNKKFKINFIPWRGNFTRGIFVSSQLKTKLKIEEVVKMYANYYLNQKFVSVTTESIFLKQVINTNKCLIQIEKVNDILVIHSIIDNLLKGASGQAIQNMNIMFGFSETAGLNLKSIAF